MKISNKLKTIAAYVPRGSTVADIGTDHAKLLIHILDENITKKVIGTDINDGPIAVTKKRYPNIDLRIGDGLKPLAEEEIDTLVISGMGGENIVKILIICYNIFIQ